MRPHHPSAGKMMRSHHSSTAKMMHLHQMAALLLLLGGCGAASTDPGTRAELQIAGAQFVPGAMPADESGPKVRQANVSNYHVLPGAHDQPFLGTLDAGATAVAIGLAGDRGYWVVVAGVPDTLTPTLPTFHVVMGFATTLPAGPVELDARAVDAAGRFGPPSTTALTVDAAPIPDGKLVITLRWDTASDLDLHVVDPSGVEIWARKPNAYRPPPPPAQPDPDGPKNAAQLDFDSNAGCVIDGRNQEDVIYPLEPAPGRYTVRVDAFSLCGQSYANWRVEAIHDGQSIGAAAGIASDADTRGAHDEGAGLTALQLDVP